MPRASKPDMSAIQAQRHRNAKAFSVGDYAQVKSLVNAKLKSQFIRDLTGWSNAVISRVKHTDTFIEYVSAVKEKARKHSVATPASQTTLFTAPENMDEKILQKLDSIEALLGIIAFGVERGANGQEEKN